MMNTEIKFVVTTRVEILQSLKEEGFYLVGIDGTVPNGADLYDELYDHHRQGGMDIQIDDMEEQVFRNNNRENDKFPDLTGVEKLAIITTMVDADAICASIYYLHKTLKVYSEGVYENYNFLKAISYDCDHLSVPYALRGNYGEKAPQVVAALKEASNCLVSELNLLSDRKGWTIEQKELFSSKAFEQGVTLINSMCKGEWDYEEVAKPYWEKVEKNTQMLINEERISLLNGVAIFDGKNLGGTYVDPRCWYRALDSLKLDTYTGIAVTQREIFVNNQFQGYSYTIGKIPFSKFDWDFTEGLFSYLTEEERKINPDADGWGGRASVGGSGWNPPSNLSPTQIVSIINNWIDTEG